MKYASYLTLFKVSIYRYDFGNYDEGEMDGSKLLDWLETQTLHYSSSCIEYFRSSKHVSGIKKKQLDIMALENIFLQKFS